MVWLEKRVKDLFNSLAEIISVQDSKSSKYQHIKDQIIKNSYKVHTNHLNIESKLDEKEDESGKQKENQLKKNELVVMQTKTLPDELPSIQG